MSPEILRPDQFCQWDTFVDSSPQGDVFCYSWWLAEITKSNFKILAVIENGEIVAGIPVAYDDQNKINIPPLTRTLGVLYSNAVYQTQQKQTSVERNWLSELLKYIPNDDFVQMCMHHNFTDWLPFRWHGLSQTTRYTYIIDYKGVTMADLWNNLDRLRKRMIDKSGQNGIRTEISDDINLVYRYESLTYERQGLKFRFPHNDLKSLDDTIKRRGNRLILKAIDNNNQVHAVIYVGYNHKSAYALLSGSDPALRDLGGHTLVMWEAIKFFHNKVEYFNFGGSDIERIENHIRGFGGTLTPYFHIYNEKLMTERNDFRFHLEEISFHLKALLKKVKNRI